MCYDDYLNKFTLFTESLDVIFVYSTYFWS